MQPLHDAEPTAHFADKSELDDLLTHILDEVLSASQRVRLNEILGASATARSYYLRYMAVHSALVTTAGNQSRSTLADELARFASRANEQLADSFESLAGPDIRPTLHRLQLFGSRRIRAAASLAAACLGGLIVLPIALEHGQNQPSAPAVLAQPPVIVERDSGDPRAARVTFVSPATRWRDPNGSHALESYVRAGQRLTLEQGRIELTYLSGAKLLLTGPSEFLVEATGGNLVRGELVARVPEAGHGFMIVTPHGKVIDLGTEFGVVVDDFGVSQVNVYEGRVETFPNAGGASQRNRIALTKGRGLQWTRGSILPIHARGRGYRQTALDAQPGVAAVALTGPALDEQFRGNPLNPSKWKTTGNVQSTSDGLQLRDSRENETPRLITRGEFAPSQGAVTVVCDLRFTNVQDADGASFAILTRCSDEKSKSGTPWQNMLATCVRCSLMGNPWTGDGTLEAGTKYEADRELSNISWEGFAGLQPDTTYRLKMRDDGLNVAFTVSLTSNPAVRKTIQCRSLFRGNHNQIAFEAAGRCTAVIERLQIEQDPLPGSDARELAAADGAGAAESASAGKLASNDLRDFAPPGATLVLEDSFDGSVLDAQTWSTLGEVVMQSGQLQLGQPNPEQHIDTWAPRPYLITRDEFDPAERPLTIIGKVTFAANFLHGYGGSFAVMTRSDERHGSGPGWENSILGRGIRFNFWPAALGQNRSMELFEKTAASGALLLSADRFQIDLQARSYLFRTVDDGHLVTLTLVDANNPKLRHTISHATAATTPARGHLAFESCWGSPVLLDDVKMYQGHLSSTSNASDSDK